MIGPRVIESIAVQMERLNRRLDNLEHMEPGTVVYKESTFSNPPTDAQLDSAFGTPANLHNGFVGIGRSTTIENHSFICWVANDNQWYYEVGTLAT